MIWIKHLVHNYIVVALSLVSIHLLFVLEYRRPIQFHYITFLFGSAVAGYFFLQFLHPGNIRAECKQYYEKNKWFSMLVFLFSIVLIVWSISYLPVLLWFYLWPFIFILIFYNLNPTRGKFFSWRKISLIKIFLVAMVWSGLTVWLPSVVFYGQVPLEKVAEIFVWILLLMIPFDIRDIILDDSGIKTFPILLGKQTIRFAFLVYLLMMILATLVWVKTNDTTAYLLKAAAGLSVIYSATISNRSDSFYFTAFWVEMIPVILLIAYLMLKRIF